MEDTGQRKTPPDRPLEPPGDVRVKKKKIEETPVVIMDDRMEEKESEIGEAAGANAAMLVKGKEPETGAVAGENDNTQIKEKWKTEASKERVQTPSYKQSLLGYNGVANGGVCMEPDELLSDDKEIFWQLPEPSEEVKKLMGTYPVVPISQDEFNEWCEPWNYSLIITVLGRKYNLYALKAHLTRLWGLTEFELVDLPNNYFVVRFTSQDLWKEHYRKVLYEGPWVIAQHCLLVQRWTPYFKPSQNQLRRIVTWVRIPEIPMHCYNSRFIARLGERIGRPLRVDLNTLSDNLAKNAKVARGRYARLCVELDLQRQLVPRIIAADEIFNIEYEGLNLICFECGRYGHRREACPWKRSPQLQQNEGCSEHSEARTPEKVLGKNKPMPRDPFGPWMFVSKPTKSRISKWSGPREGQMDRSYSQKVSRKDNLVLTKSRFAVLDDMEQERREYKGEENPETSMKEDINASAKEMTATGAVENGTMGTLVQGMSNKTRVGNGSKSSSKLKNTGSRIQGRENVKPKAIGLNGLEGTNKPKESQIVVGTKQVEKTQVSSKRTHNVVTGSLGQLLKKDEGITKQILAESNVRQQMTGEQGGVEVRDQQNDTLRFRRCPNINQNPNVDGNPKPPDPGNHFMAWDDGIWEEAETDLADDQSEDLEFVPATDESR